MSPAKKDTELKDRTSGPDKNKAAQTGKSPRKEAGTTPGGDQPESSMGSSLKFSKTDPGFMLGSHLSSSGGFMKMLKDMDAIDANTFQYFSRNPRGSSVKKLDSKDMEMYMAMKQQRELGPILAHAPYTLNPASADEKVREFARMVLLEDLDRMELTPGNLYNFHPGSHVGQGVAAGIDWIVEALNRALDRPLQTKVLLETMAGKGSEIGRTFEELAMIIRRVEHQDALGVCLDTCHVHDAGYDIVNDLDGMLEDFDRIIGLDKLHAIHINDSKNPLSSHKDRHEKIGAGNIGLEAFRRIINHPSLRDKPFFLETPNELSGYAEEIKLLRSIRI